jgi:hypothetical protein
LYRFRGEQLGLQFHSFYDVLILVSGAVGGKTGKTSVLPRFSKIERGGGSGTAACMYDFDVSYLEKRE